MLEFILNKDIIQIPLFYKIEEIFYNIPHAIGNQGRMRIRILEHSLANIPLVDISTLYRGK